jgi:hypothetical protein
MHGAVLIYTDAVSIINAGEFAVKLDFSFIGGNLKAGCCLYQNGL